MPAIWSKVKKLLCLQSGSALVLIALMMTVFLGISALVTDAGLLYLNGLTLANAMDAAALAGAQALPGDPGRAVDIACEYAQKNGIEPENLDIVVSGDGMSLTVTGQRQVDFIFARVFGYVSTGLEKSAQACVGALESVTGAVPLSIEEQVLCFSEEYLLKHGAGGETGGTGLSGWFGALRLGGSGASVYRANLENGYEGKLSVGDIIPVEPGNMSGPTTQGVEYRLTECGHSPECTWDNFVPGCPRIILVPVVSPYDEHNVRITGFAAFFLEGVDGQGNECDVWGRFIEMHLPGIPSEEGANNYGVYSAYLRY